MKHSNTKLIGKIAIALTLIATTAFAQGWTTSGTNTFTNPLGNKVGIGTSSPGASLSIAGKTVVIGGNTPLGSYGTNDALLDIQTSGASFVQVTSNISGTNYNRSMFFSGPYITGSAWGLMCAKSGTNSVLPFVIFNNNGEQFRIATDGNVGIATTTPTQTLDVNGRINVSQGVIQRGGSAITSTSDLGLYSLVSGNLMRFVTNGGSIRFFADGGSNPIGNTSLFNIEANGNVGVGTASPLTKLQVGDGLGKVGLGACVGAATGYGTSYIGFNAARSTSGWVCNTDGANNGGNIIYGDVGGSLRFVTIPKSSTGSATQTLTDDNVLNATKMIITSTGNVGIGTTDTKGYKLAVNGSVVATAVTVKLYGNWPDYIFTEGHKLTPLNEVAEFIQQNKHLPNVPSAAEVENSGINLAQMDAKLLEKIEELTLYIINLQKQIDELKK